MILQFKHRSLNFLSRWKWLSWCKANRGYNQRIIILYFRIFSNYCNLWPWTLWPPVFILKLPSLKKIRTGKGKNYFQIQWLKSGVVILLQCCNFSQMFRNFTNWRWKYLTVNPWLKIHTLTLYCLVFQIWNTNCSIKVKITQVVEG